MIRDMMHPISVVLFKLNSIVEFKCYDQWLYYSQLTAKWLANSKNTKVDLLCGKVEWNSSLSVYRLPYTRVPTIGWGSTEIVIPESSWYIKLIAHYLDHHIVNKTCFSKGLQITSFLIVSSGYSRGHLIRELHAHWSLQCSTDKTTSRSRVWAVAVSTCRTDRTLTFSEKTFNIGCRLLYCIHNVRFIIILSTQNWHKMVQLHKLTYIQITIKQIFHTVMSSISTYCQTVDLTTITSNMASKVNVLDFGIVTEFQLLTCEFAMFRFDLIIGKRIL